LAVARWAGVDSGCAALGGFGLGVCMSVCAVVAMSMQFSVTKVMICLLNFDETWVVQLHGAYFFAIFETCVFARTVCVALVLSAIPWLSVEVYPGKLRLVA
jgi:hypothetical protein